MFTGSVMGVGEVVDVSMNVTIAISRSSTLYQRFQDLKVGESVAVDGQAAKVGMVQEDCQQLVFTVGIRNGSGSVHLKVKDKVSLERCTLATSKFSGIFMLGLIDGIGTITSVLIELQDNYVFTVHVPKEIMKMISTDGIIIVDGVALIVTQVDDEKSEFKFVIYRYTKEVTSLGSKTQGEQVNVELDILSKYVARYHPNPAYLPILKH